MNTYKLPTTRLHITEWRYDEISGVFDYKVSPDNSFLKFRSMKLVPPIPQEFIFSNTELKSYILTYENHRWLQRILFELDNNKKEAEYYLNKGEYPYFTEIVL